MAAWKVQKIAQKCKTLQKMVIDYVKYVVHDLWYRLKQQTLVWSIHFKRNSSQNFHLFILRIPNLYSTNEMFQNCASAEDRVPPANHPLQRSPT